MNNLVYNAFIITKLVHKGSLTFWIDSRGCWCSCSSSTAAAAAAAGLFTDIRPKKVANWIVQKVIYLVWLNLVHNDFFIFWIDSKECCCSTTAADAALLLQMQHYCCNCNTATAAAAHFSCIKLSLIVIFQIIQFSAFTSLTWCL